MPPETLSCFNTLTYIGLASLAYAVLVYVLRPSFHRTYSRLPAERQVRLRSIWRRSIVFTRVALVVTPVSSLIVALVLRSQLEISLTVTVPPFAILCLNLLVVHIDRLWHLRALSSSLTPPGA
jgi:hypothetical protein